MTNEECMRSVDVEGTIQKLLTTDYVRAELKLLEG
jgi:hypothetical protein